jgi:hypothetical protein
MAAEKFLVVIDATLTAKQISAIDKAIQSAALKEIARIDNGVFAQKIDLGPGIKGKYIKNFKTLEALKKNAAFRRI